MKKKRPNKGQIQEIISLCTETLLFVNSRLNDPTITVEESIKAMELKNKIERVLSFITEQPDSFDFATLMPIIREVMFILGRIVINDATGGAEI